MLLSSRLSARLPAMTIGLALMSAATMGGISWYSARTSLLKAAGERLHLAASARQDSIELTADRMQADFVGVAAHPQIVSNFPDLIETLDPAKPETAGIVDAFRAPKSVAERIALDGGPATGMYGRRHGKVQEIARKIVAQPGYGDLMFLDEAGHVAYTTTKGEDFAATVADGPLKATGLARLVERLKAAEPNAVLYEDFAPYPVGSGPSAFIGRAMSKRANVAMGTSQAVERIGFVVMRVTPACSIRCSPSAPGSARPGRCSPPGRTAPCAATRPSPRRRRPARPSRRSASRSPTSRAARASPTRPPTARRWAPPPRSRCWGRPGP